MCPVCVKHIGGLPLVTASLTVYLSKDAIITVYQQLSPTVCGHVIAAWF